MSYSLNEIEALCRKAARGAGYGWGHAEDAGKAARWLQAHGVSGAQALLNRLEGAEDTASPIEISNDVWCSSGSLCPIIAGACLADHAARIGAHAQVLQGVRHPILLAPFAASIAAITHRAIRLDWAGASVICQTNGAEIAGSDDALMVATTDTVTCSFADVAGLSPTAPLSRAELNPDIYNRLNTLAARTYAPATEASRKAGAGAGLTDND